MNINDLRKDDVFTTDFWGVNEVCMITDQNDGIVTFQRLEAVKKNSPMLATLTRSDFPHISIQLLHRSRWYESTTKLEPSICGDEGADYNEHPDFEQCSSCGRRYGHHLINCPVAESFWIDLV